jgi:hypothetical protein
VFRQAVHEIGHAVAACLLGMPFCEVRIIYDPAVEPAFDVDEVIKKGCADKLDRLRLMYAAGAAAEELLFRQHWRCGTDDDREWHAKCQGTNFDSDVARIKSHSDFTPDRIRRVAKLLENRYRIQRETHLTASDIEDELTRQGIHVVWQAW